MAKAGSDDCPERRGAQRKTGTIVRLLWAGTVDGVRNSIHLAVANPKIGAGLVLCTAFLAATRFFVLIHRHAVNVLFWDQWDFWSPMFEGRSLWEMFRWQHGPHRQGVGFLVSKLIAETSGWNTRAEAFGIGAILCASVALALWLKKRTLRSITWTDLVVPLLFLTPTQYELFAVTPNPAHGAVPLFLLMAYCLSLTIEHHIIRTTLLVTIGFLLVHTGFGLFVGAITPAFFALEGILLLGTGNWRMLTTAAVGLFFSLLSDVIFLADYRFLPAVDNFEFPHPNWWRYPQIVALAFAKFCAVEGVGTGETLLGTMVLLAVLLAGYRYSHLLMRPADPNRQLALIVVVLVTFSMLFAVFMAVGRISLGLEPAQSSRYMTYLIPAFFGLYLFILAFLRGWLRTAALATYVAGCMIVAGPVHSHDASAMRSWSSGKIRWKDAYRTTGDIERANDISGFLIYPSAEATGLSVKLRYLEERKLNLYKELQGLPP